MSGEIRAAAQRMEARKDAAQIAGIGQMVDEDTARMIFSGVGLDFDEVMEMTPRVQSAIFIGLLQGLAPTAIGAGLYFDGIVTGLLIAEAREREEAAA